MDKSTPPQLFSLLAFLCLLFVSYFVSYCHVKTAKSLILSLVFTLILFHEVKFRTSKKSCTNSVFMLALEDLGIRFDGRGNVFGFMKSTTPKPCVESSILSAPAMKTTPQVL